VLFLPCLSYTALRGIFCPAMPAGEPGQHPTDGQGRQAPEHERSRVPALLLQATVQWILRRRPNATAKAPRQRTPTLRNGVGSTRASRYGCPASAPCVPKGRRLTTCPRPCPGSLTPSTRLTAMLSRAFASCSREHRSSDTRSAGASTTRLPGETFPHLTPRPLAHAEDHGGGLLPSRKDLSTPSP